MAMPKLGTLKKVDPREAWKNEPRQFTPWLAENIALLGEAIGLELDLIGREEAVGPFAVDLYAKDLNSNRTVVIENQLNSTDHSHLGQLLTYASGLDAGVIVWISTDVKEEHRQAISWLNENTNEDVWFFAIELELLQIDESALAPHFKLVAFPNEWQKSAKRRPTTSERGEKYQHFFTELLDMLRSKRIPAVTLPRKAGTANWASFSAGRTGFSYSLSFAQSGKFRIELYIDTGTQELNKELFDKLLRQKNEIEAALGKELSWERLDHRRASRIALYTDGEIMDEPQALAALQEWAVDNFLRFQEVMGGHIAEL